MEEAALQEKTHPGRWIVTPLQRFFRTEAIGGILLLFSASVALILANSPLSEIYHHFLEFPIRLGVGDYVIDKSTHHWINEGLMVLFFFLVGLEIKRAMLAGELASFRKAVFPFAAAIGGMVLPASVFIAFNFGGPGSKGWGIPMATDIAFALGILAMLGKRIPPGLVVFLSALAIIDDLGSVLVIALFYGGSISAYPLLIGLVTILISYGANRMGFRQTMVYVVLGVATWLAFLDSGIHATVAGVLLAMTIPHTSLLTGNQFTARIESLLGQFKSRDSVDNSLKREEDQQTIIHQIEEACQDVEAPLQDIEHKLHPWVTYLVMPLFAFTNAGVEIHIEAIQGILTQPISVGIILGLVLGKQVGITLFAWGSVRLGWAELPRQTTWRQIYGVSWLAGIGFTMSLFIGSLAFVEPHLILQTKIGILTASLIAGVGGYFLLRGWSTNE